MNQVNLMLLIVFLAFTSSNIMLIQKNYILDSIDKNDFFCLRSTLFFIFVIFYATFIKTDTFNNLQKIDKSKWKFILLDLVLSITNVFLWYYLLVQSDAHKLTGTFNPLKIIMITLLSYYFYKTSVTKEQIAGIVLVILGVLLINRK